jgi:peptidoglycan/LPS O-acetylase OafA/YrhL
MSKAVLGLLRDWYLSHFRGAIFYGKLTQDLNRVPEATSVSAKDKTAPAKVHAEQRITALDGVRGTAIVLAAVALWRGRLDCNDWPMRTLGYSLLALLFACLVGYVVTTDGRIGRFLSNPILVSFGKYSYGIYIFHVLVLTLCERFLGPRLFPKLGLPAEAPLPLFALSMGLVFTLAYLSWHLYEKRFRALRERFVSL